MERFLLNDSSRAIDLCVCASGFLVKSNKSRFSFLFSLNYVKTGIDCFAKPYIQHRCRYTHLAQRDGGRASCREGDVALGRLEECVCACERERERENLCMCIRKNRELKMETETPRGKFPFAWLASDNSLLEEETEGSRNTKENYKPGPGVLSSSQS